MNGVKPYWAIIPIDHLLTKVILPKNIHIIKKKAEEKARKTIITDLMKVSSFDYEELFINEKYQIERQLFSIADTIALLIEILELKFRGYQLEWFDYLWANTVSKLEEKIKDYQVLKPLVEELKREYQKEKKSPNPYLTKSEFQKKKD